MLVMRCLVLLLASQFLLATAQADDSALREYRLKAAYLYNFARYVTWPSGDVGAHSDSINICTSGEDPFGEALDAITGKSISGRRVAVQRLVKMTEIANCHVLFVGSEADYETVLKTAEGRPILTVGEGQRFIQLGGIIRFRIDVKRRQFEENVIVRFDINKDTADRSGLQISSRLLQVATIVSHGNESAH